MSLVSISGSLCLLSLLRFLSLHARTHARTHTHTPLPPYFWSWCDSSLPSERAWLVPAVIARSLTPSQTSAFFCSLSTAWHKSVGAAGEPRPDGYLVFYARRASCCTYLTRRQWRRASFGSQRPILCSFVCVAHSKTLHFFSFMDFGSAGTLHLSLNVELQPTVSQCSRGLLLQSVEYCLPLRTREPLSVGETFVY